MKTNRNPMQQIMKFGLILMTVISISACSKTTWKEEVALHDGTTLIVERSQVRGGLHELGQGSTITAHSMKFTLPGSDKAILWKSEKPEEIGYDSMGLLAFDLIGGVPYVVLRPVGCLSYNKWGRPNPPYVVFKYVDQQWRRLPVSELPGEITKPNLLIDTYGHYDVEETVKSGFVSASSVRRFNGSLTQEEYKAIVHHEIKVVSSDCGKKRYDGRVWSSVLD